MTEQVDLDALIAEARGRVLAHNEFARRMGGYKLRLAELYAQHGKLADALESILLRSCDRSGNGRIGTVTRGLSIAPEPQRGMSTAMSASRRSSPSLLTRKLSTGRRSSKTTKHLSWRRAV